VGEGGSGACGDGGDGDGGLTRRRVSFGESGFELEREPAVGEDGGEADLLAAGEVCEACLVAVGTVTTMADGPSSVGEGCAPSPSSCKPCTPPAAVGRAKVRRSESGDGFFGRRSGLPSRREMT